MAHPIAIVSQHKGCHAVEKGVLCIEGLDEEDTAHRYGPNSFKLRRLPAPRPGEVLGLVGTHSIGKTTALNVLAGLLKPNLGRFNDPPDWPDILTHLHDRQLITYFTHILENKPTIVFKPQHIYGHLRKGYNNVGKMLESYDQRGKMKEVCDALELNRYLHLRLDRLSGGLLQRVTIAAIALQKADVYIFDEPSNFLDVTQRFKAAQVIRSLISPHSYVIVVDNDLSVIDYISDAVYCLYGKPEAYGVFTQAFNVRAGIEIYLDGFDPLENQRLRGESRIFEAARTAAYDGYKEDWRIRNYPDMTLTRRSFKLQVTGAELKDAQIFVVLGANGTGKTTFIQMLAGLHSADEVEGVKLWRPLFMESYKPQIINLKSGCTVRELLEKKHRIAGMHPRFISDVLIPLQIEQLMDRDVASLSLGETQRLAIARCLAEPASVYLIDEPSEYLDSDERISAAVAIRRHILRRRKAAIIVEHDFMMATYLADQVILVEETQPSTTEIVTSSPSTTEFVISSPYPRVIGLNKFLSHQNITFRRDPLSFKFAPRVNKLGSIEDKEQKRAGNYYDLN